MAGKLYFISGLGADSRVFCRQAAAGIPFVMIDWIQPGKGESLQDYAQRLVSHITFTEADIIAGVSLGAMMAQEVAVRNPVKKVIVISSAKGSKELPFYYKLLRYLPLYKLMPLRLYKPFVLLTRPLFGKMDQDEKKLFNDMVADADPFFIRWAIEAVVNWRRTDFLQNVLHIHGSYDLIFPAPLLRKRPDEMLRGGGHFMIVTAANKINKILFENLKNTN